MKPNNDKLTIFRELIEEGVLTVYRDGRVKNNDTKRFIGYKGRNGYMNIGVKYRGKVVHCLVHRLIFDQFGSDPLDPNKTINHIDGKKDNNIIENLEQISMTENNRHAAETGLRNPISEERKEELRETLSGEGGYSSILTNEDARNIRKRYAMGNITHRELARAYGVGRSTITEVLTGKSFKNIRV